MKVKCFECAALMEAHDADAVAHAFVAHGQERHVWSYPEEAIRNYARNYGEATERLTGGTERLSEIADVTVQRVAVWDGAASGDGLGGHLPVEHSVRQRVVDRHVLGRRRTEASHRDVEEGCLRRSPRLFWLRRRSLRQMGFAVTADD